MSSWEELAGNSGFMEVERFLTLLRLTLVNGLETDVTIPGTELPILEKPLEALHAGKWCDVPGYKVGAGQIWHVKGWKRLLAANFAVLLLRETNLINDYINAAEPEVIHNFKFAYGKILDTAGDYTKSVMTNREATLKSTQVRQKPNCFNNSHQLDKMILIMQQGGEHDSEALAEAFRKSLSANKISIPCPEDKLPTASPILARLISVPSMLAGAGGPCILSVIVSAPKLDIFISYLYSFLHINQTMRLQHQLQLILIQIVQT